MTCFSVAQAVEYIDAMRAHSEGKTLRKRRDLSALGDSMIALDNLPHLSARATVDTLHIPAAALSQLSAEQRHAGEALNELVANMRDHHQVRAPR